jgi:hypothetical protein
MVVPEWVDPVAKASEIIGAAVEIAALTREIRERRRAPQHRAPSGTRAWLRVAIAAGTIAIATFIVGSVAAASAMDIAAIVAAATASAALAVYAVTRRRQRPPFPEDLGVLIERQYAEARQHTYLFTVGSAVPPIPEIYVEQYAVVALPPAGRRPRITLDSMLRDNPNAVILADPGAGKSTAVAKILGAQCGWLRDARRVDRAVRGRGAFTLGCA